MGKAVTLAFVALSGCILAMLCEISDLGGDTAPQLWRYFGV